MVSAAALRLLTVERAAAPLCWRLTDADSWCGLPSQTDHLPGLNPSLPLNSIWYVIHTCTCTLSYRYLYFMYRVITYTGMHVLVINKVVTPITMFISYSQVKQHQFRENFRKIAPFAYDSKDVYTLIDKVLGPFTNTCTCIITTCCVVYMYSL